MNDFHLKNEQRDEVSETSFEGITDEGSISIISMNPEPDETEDETITTANVIVQKIYTHRSLRRSSNIL